MQMRIRNARTRYSAPGRQRPTAIAFAVDPSCTGCYCGGSIQSARKPPPRRFFVDALEHIGGVSREKFFTEIRHDERPHRTRLHRRRRLPDDVLSRTVAGLAELRRRDSRRGSAPTRRTLQVSRTRLRPRAVDARSRGGFSARRVSRVRLQCPLHRTRRTARQRAVDSQRRFPRSVVRRPARARSPAVRLHRRARRLQLGRE